MTNNLSKYGQYKKDIFEKLGYRFSPGKKILDLGCGDGSDAEIFINEFKMDVFGVDIYKNERLGKIKNLKFKTGGIYKIPFEDSFFDYVFLHDVLHHIDEKEQRKSKHISGLKELHRVCKKEGTIIIVEGNRYNPLFYPHMVKICGHNHFTQKYFKNLVLSVFPWTTFKYFEAHFYPKKYLKLWKLYEKIMELIAPKRFLAYNVAIINNKED